MRPPDGNHSHSSRRDLPTSLSRLDDNGMESGVAKFVSRSQTGEAGTDDHQRRADRRSGNGQWR
jgi:hypothetical protein